VLQSYPAFCRAIIDAGDIRLNKAIVDLESRYEKVCGHCSEYPRNTPFLSELQLLVRQRKEGLNVADSYPLFALAQFSVPEFMLQAHHFT
jgi:hypothetical protein